MDNTKPKILKLDKDAINIIRTTLRNNVELTHIADNKANVLLSLTAIMITFLIPNVVANMEYIEKKHLYIPLIILSTTCLLTILICTIVLKPIHFDKLRDKNDPIGRHSPFFFGNFYKMKPKEYYQYMQESLDKGSSVRQHLAQDLYYLGRRLGYKMTWIRRAFDIFLGGIFLTLLTTALAFFPGH